MKDESKENKNSLLAICRSSEAAGGARSNCYEFFGSFCRYKKNEEKLLSPAANDNPELFQHYFNANHLGSGSLITDESGATYQTLAYAPHGEILVNDFAGDYDEPYKFTGYERDQESGLDYAHARYREPDKTIFYSTDPMWFKYPHITPYNYAGNNPVRYTDPDGRWIPGLDENNNVTITREEGDDIKSLKTFMGTGYTDGDINCLGDFMNNENGTINLTSTLGGVFQEMTTAINEAQARNNPVNANYDVPGGLKGTNLSENYNCWGTAIALNEGKKLEGTGPGTGVGIGSPFTFDNILTNDYTPTNRSGASVGKTVVRYADSRNEGTHGATFMGVDRSGNEYLFSKNGWAVQPEIHTTNYIKQYLPEYGTIRGIKTRESGYYNKK